MLRILDVAPLRSFVAVADCGGFQRAANSLHLSQGAVSQHVRRLEAAVGRPLVERQGRGSRFTADGDTLLRQARRILALHDETLRDFGVESEQTLVIGSTEHAAAQLLPGLASSLAEALPDCRLRFRVDRGAQLREALADGRIDVALLLGSSDDLHAKTVGALELTWYSAPGWTPPGTAEPVPLVAFDDPCALRSRALETLSAHGIPVEVNCEAAHLAGVQAAVKTCRHSGAGRWGEGGGPASGGAGGGGNGIVSSPAGTVAANALTRNSTGSLSLLIPDRFDSVLKLTVLVC